MLVELVHPPPPKSQLAFHMVLPCGHLASKACTKVGQQAMTFDPVMVAMCSIMLTGLQAKGP